MAMCIKKYHGRLKLMSGFSKTAPFQPSSLTKSSGRQATSCYVESYLQNALQHSEEKYFLLHCFRFIPMFSNVSYFLPFKNMGSIKKKKKNKNSNKCKLIHSCSTSLLPKLSGMRLMYRMMRKKAHNSNFICALLNRARIFRGCASPLNNSVIAGLVLQSTQVILP